MVLLRELGVGLLGGVVSWTIPLGALVLRRALFGNDALSRAATDGDLRFQVAALGSILVGCGLGGVLCGALLRKASYRPALLMFSMTLFGPGVSSYNELLTRSRSAERFSGAELLLLVGVATVTIFGVWIGWELRSRRSGRPSAQNSSIE